MLLAGSLAGSASQAMALYRDMLFVHTEAGVQYDSNVFRISDALGDAAAQTVLRGRDKGDFVWSARAGASASVPVSRQRFRADLSATKYRYNDLGELDYTGYDARGAWDWRLGNFWHGELSAGTRRTRQAYSSVTGAFVPRLYRAHDALVDVRHALTPRWELQASLQAIDFDNEEGRGLDDFRHRVLNAGVLYRTPLGNSTGARLRYEDGEWPNRPPASVAFFGNHYAQHTLSAVLDWRFAGRSRLSGDVGWTFRKRDAFASRDFDGPSGRLNYDYSLTGKTTLHASLYQTRGGVDDFTATYLRTTGIDAGVLYQASAKVSLQFTASHRRHDFLGESLVPNATQRHDTRNGLGLEATYLATRLLSFAAGAQYERRNSNAVLGDYRVFTGYLRARVQF